MCQPTDFWPTGSRFSQRQYILVRLIKVKKNNCQKVIKPKSVGPNLFFIRYSEYGASEFPATCFGRLCFEQSSKNCFFHGLGFYRLTFNPSSKPLPHWLPQFKSQTFLVTPKNRVKYELPNDRNPNPNCMPFGLLALWAFGLSDFGLLVIRAFINSVVRNRLFSHPNSPITLPRIATHTSDTGSKLPKVPVPSRKAYSRTSIRTIFSATSFGN